MSNKYNAKQMREHEQKKLELFAKNPLDYSSKKIALRVIHKLCLAYPCSELVNLFCQQPHLLLVKTIKGKTPFHYLCCNNKAFSVAQQLLQALPKDIVQSIINEPCQVGYTPAMYACRNGEYFVKMLHQFGANLNHVAKAGASMYHFAARDLHLLEYVSKYANSDLALTFAKNMNYLSAVGLSMTRYLYCKQYDFCLPLLVKKLKLPLEFSTKTYFSKLASKTFDTALQYIIEWKLNVPALFIAEVIRSSMLQRYTEALLLNCPTVKLETWILRYCDLSCFPLVCDRVPEDVLSTVYDLWLHGTKPRSLPAIKEYIMHSANASTICKYATSYVPHDLPIRDFLFRNMHICAYDAYSLRRRLRRLQVNVRTAFYFDGNKWSNNYEDWNAIPYETKLEEIKIYKVAPLVFTDISFQCN